MTIFLWNLLPDRRGFLTRVALLFGGMIGALMLPNGLVRNDLVFAVGQKDRAIGRKQRDLLAACQTVSNQLGVFRTMMIEHYANDGEVEMTWTMILPPENSIKDSTVNLAQQINSLAQNN